MRERRKCFPTSRKGMFCLSKVSELVHCKDSVIPLTVADPCYLAYSSNPQSSRRVLRFSSKPRQSIQRPSSDSPPTRRRPLSTLPSPNTAQLESEPLNSPTPSLSRLSKAFNESLVGFATFSNPFTSNLLLRPSALLQSLLVPLHSPLNHGNRPSPRTPLPPFPVALQLPLLHLEHQFLPDQALLVALVDPFSKSKISKNVNSATFSVKYAFN